MRMRNLCILTILTLLILFLYLHNFNSASYEQIITKLTSNEFRGRFAGDIGNEKAAVYIANQFKSIGIDNFFENNYYQEFSMETFNLDKQIAKMKIYYTDGSSYICEYGKDFLEESKEVNLNIVTKLNLDKESMDSNNAIVFLDNHEQIHSLIKEPRCILLLDESLNNYPSNKHQHVPVVKISANLYKRLNEKPIEKIEINLQFIKEIKEVKNVIGKISGKNNKNAVVISAHFDHVGWAGSQIYRGAIDNATGCAVLFDVAKKLSVVAKSNPFDSDILICAFNGEELHLSGSKAFIKSISDIYTEIYNINIDSIGVKDSTNIIIEGDDKSNKSLKEALSEYLFRDGIQHDIVSRGGLSDNISFEQSNIASISISNEWSNVLHTVKDKKNLIDYRTLEIISKVIADFIKNNNKEIFKPDINKISNEELRKLMPKLREEFAKDISFDELKLVDYEGTKVLFSGSAKVISPTEFSKFYPSVNINSEFKEYIFDSLKVSAEPIAIENSIKVENELLEEGIIYKRDLSRNLVSSINLYYIKNNSKLVISFTKITPTMRDSLHIALEEDRLDYDKIYYRRATDNSNAIYRSIEIENQKYWIDITNYSLIEEEKDYSETDTIYNLQKGFDYSNIIKAIF